MMIRTISLSLSLGFTTNYVLIKTCHVSFYSCVKSCVPKTYSK